ncbi:Uncharacterised protein [Mycobacterium tuberculosis]|nr:Uncharacterised protein [Mycobacterium tuberculosis]
MWMENGLNQDLQPLIPKIEVTTSETASMKSFVFTKESCTNGMAISHACFAVQKKSSWT